MGRTVTIGETILRDAGVTPATIAILDGVLQIGLNLFQVASAQLYQNNWHLVFAYIVMMSLPMIVIFVVAQRRIISGVTSGAVK